jgi:hypothetical protein
MYRTPHVVSIELIVALGRTVRALVLRRLDRYACRIVPFFKIRISRDRLFDAIKKGTRGGVMLGASLLHEIVSDVGQWWLIRKVIL